MESIDICGVRVSAVNLASACDSVSGWIGEGTKTYVCVVPVSTIVACQSDTNYLDVINNAGMATPDGMPLVWLGQWRGYRDIRRTYGPDLMLALCDLSQKRGYRHFLYGGSRETSQLLEDLLKKQFPHLNIVGRLSPPSRPLHTPEDPQAIEEINRTNADILWVGLGSPKQDFWMAQHRPQLTVPVMIGVGAAFDFLAMTKKQAPRWMQQAGLEWFFRLCCEPKRLWRRYLIGNSKFIYYLLQDSLKQTFRRRRKK